jgi:hypothetical protein
MTDEELALIHECAYRLRGRLTLIMLCSHTLKLDLRDVLTWDHQQEFQQMDRVLDEAKALLNTLLRQVEAERGAAAPPKGEPARLMGGRVGPENVA